MTDRRIYSVSCRKVVKMRNPNGILTPVFYIMPYHAYMMLLSGWRSISRSTAPRKNVGMPK